MAADQPYGCTLPFSTVAQCVRVFEAARQFPRCAQPGVKVELEARVQFNFSREVMDVILQNIRTPHNLLEAPPITSAIRWHHASDLRCVTYMHSNTCFWERKRVLALARLSLGPRLHAKLVASVESPDSRPDNYEQYDLQRTRQRWSAVYADNWRLDLTLVNEQYCTVEYEWVKDAVPRQTHTIDAAMRNLQNHLLQWVAAHMLVTHNLTLGPTVPFVRVDVNIPVHASETLKAAAAVYNLRKPAVSLTRSRLQNLNGQDWAASAKMDGIRAHLVCCSGYAGYVVLHLPRAERTETYVIAANNCINALTQRGNFVLDGELLPALRTFVAFDVLVYNDNPCTQGYGERLSLAQGLARDVRLSWPLKVTAKRLWPLHAASRALSVPHNDGIILHELNGAGRTFKYKQVHTVDVYSNGSRLFLRNGEDVGSAKRARAGCWECRFDSCGQLQPIFLRLDKGPQGNSRKTYTEVRQAHSDGLTPQNIERAH